MLKLCGQLGLSANVTSLRSENAILIMLLGHPFDVQGHERDAEGIVLVNELDSGRRRPDAVAVAAKSSCKVQWNSKLAQCASTWSNEGKYGNAVTQTTNTEDNDQNLSIPLRVSEYVPMTSGAKLSSFGLHSRCIIFSDYIIICWH